MIRIGLASVLGFVLFYIESLIVMHLKGSQTIEFGEMAPFINIWAMNFFFVFAISTQIWNWLQNKGLVENEDENNLY